MWVGRAPGYQCKDYFPVGIEVCVNLIILLISRSLEQRHLQEINFYENTKALIEPIIFAK